MTTTLANPHLHTRPKIEEILEVACPRCGARPGAWCDRSGERLHGQARLLRGRGTPPSHTERMWSRQGHEPSEFPVLRENLRPFGPARTPESAAPSGRRVTRAEFAAMVSGEPADLYRQGLSACVIALLCGLTRTGAEQKIRKSGLGGNQWCPVHRCLERL